MIKKEHIALSALISIQLITLLCRRKRNISLGVNCGCGASQKKCVKKIIQPTISPVKKPQLVLLSSESTSKNAVKVANQKQTTYQKDLNRWGTKQGVKEVADKTIEKEKRREQLTKMGKVGSSLLSAYQKATQSKKRIPKDYKRWLEKEFKSTQVTLTNTTDEMRYVRLWGTNNDLPLTDPLPPPEVENHIIANGLVAVGVHPQGLAFNPVNGYAYVANQLSDDVSVISPEGEIVAVIDLTRMDESISPVDVAVNTNPSSSNYGNVYVAGSIANTVSVIDIDHSVINRITVGNRPIAIAYNSQNDSVYVANIADNTLSVIDNTYTVITTLPTGDSPRDVAINTSNGSIYVANSRRDDVTVYDTSNALLTTVNGISDPISLAYHPEQNEMYVVSSSANHVRVIASDFSVSSPISTGRIPHTIVYNRHNNLMYVGNKRDRESYTIINPDRTVRTSLSLGLVNIGIAVNPFQNQLFSTNTRQNSVTIIGFPKPQLPVVTNESYELKKRQFQYSPVLVKHAKFIATANTPLSVLTLKQQESRGKTKETKIPLNAYQSPQQLINVADVYALEKSIINGNNSWEFALMPKQRISIIIYYKQLEVERLLPQKKFFNYKQIRR